MTETRQVVSIRLTKTLLEAVDAVALAELQTRTDIIERLVSQGLNPAQPANLPVDPPVVPHKARNTTSPPIGTCTHPKAARAQYDWGSKCLTCGKINPPKP